MGRSSSRRRIPSLKHSDGGCDVPIAIRPSAVHGLGAFATTPIAAGRSVVEYEGEHIGREEALRRMACAEHALGEYVFEIDGERFVDASRSGGPGRYVNHSCAPNCRIERRGGRAWIVALRDIAAGEELAYDYAFDPAYSIPCRCGAAQCRGRI